jgi:hypothetical protein
MNRRLVLLAAPFFLSACASVSVKDVARKDGEKAGRPAQLAVAPFAVVEGTVRENPNRKNPGKLGSDAQSLLKGYLVEELGKLGIPVITVDSQSAPANGWLIGGQITRLAEGNRLLRMSIGLGSGGTKFETAVHVKDARARNILSFATTGGSNAMPGGVTNPIPFAGVPTAILRSKDGITDDAARTARMIAGTIGNYLADRGWIPRDKVPVVKLARPQ